MLIAAGVPCPSDVKRKLAIATQKKESKKKQSTEDQEIDPSQDTGNERRDEKSSEVTKQQPSHAMGSRSRGIRGQPVIEENFFNQLTPA
jgi:hypothetical protein